MYFLIMSGYHANLGSQATNYLKSIPPNFPNALQPCVKGPGHPLDYSLTIRIPVSFLVGWRRSGLSA